MTEDNLARAREQALAQLESICEMVAALDSADDNIDWEDEAEKLGFVLMQSINEDGDEIELWTKDEDGAARFDDAEDACRSVKEYLSADDARQRIHEDALSVQVRSGWHSPGESADPEEYEILLCTGGPAVRIRGDLNSYNEPETAELEYQDWFTPWTALEDAPRTMTPSDMREALLTYARCFYYGE